jgi:hypothetical protein
MLGDTVTVTLGGSGGTERELKKINQDNYSAEYLDRISTDEVRLKVRHTIESAKNGNAALDRHNVELTQTVFATLTEPEYTRQFYFVFRFAKGDTEADAVDVAEAVTYLSDATFLGQIAGWES